MLKFDMLPLARWLDCEAEVQAYTGAFVGWRFFVAVLREMPPHPKVRAEINRVIAGMDRQARGKDWPEAAADADAAANAARNLTKFAEFMWPRRISKVSAAAAWAAAWAADAAAWDPDTAWEGKTDPTMMATEVTEWAAEAGVPIARQREILLRLVEEA